MAIKVIGKSGNKQDLKRRDSFIVCVALAAASNSRRIFTISDASHGKDFWKKDLSRVSLHMTRIKQNISAMPEDICALKAFLVDKSSTNQTTPSDSLEGSTLEFQRCVLPIFTVAICTVYNELQKLIEARRFEIDKISAICAVVEACVDFFQASTTSNTQKSIATKLAKNLSILHVFNSSIEQHGARFIPVALLVSKPTAKKY